MSHTLSCVVSQGGITAIDLSPSSEDIIASAGRDHTVQIYDRSASHSCPLNTLYIVCMHTVPPYMLLCQKHFALSCIVYTDQIYSHVIVNCQESRV